MIESGLLNKLTQRLRSKIEIKIANKMKNRTPNQKTANRIDSSFLYEYVMCHYMSLTDLLSINRRFYYCLDQKVKYRTAKIEALLL